MNKPSWTLLLLLAACQDKDPDEDTAVETPVGPDTPDSPSTPTSSTSLSPLEACMQAAGMDLACDSEPSVEWVIAGETVPCVASADFGAMGRFHFDLDKVEDGNPQIDAFRLEPETGDVPNSGGRLSFSLAERVLVTPKSPLATDLDWSLVLEASLGSMAMGFEGTTPAQTSLVFDEEVYLAEQLSGATVTGSFTFSGGSYQLGDTGTVSDDTAEGAGCFNVSVELTPL